jgi:hypothetical protein
MGIIISKPGWKANHFAAMPGDFSFNNINAD